MGFELASNWTIIEQLLDNHRRISKATPCVDYQLLTKNPAY